MSTVTASPPLRTSIAELLAEYDPEELAKHVGDDDRKRSLSMWRTWARPEQVPPRGDWLTWLFQAGRGAGKTRAAAEWVKHKVDTGQARKIALLAREPSAIRQVMIGEETDSGLLGVYPPGQKPDWEPSLRKLTFHNGAIAYTYSSENPDQLRGPQHDLAWCDELATFRDYAAWDNLQMGLRLGQHPQQVVSTTPRPKRVIREVAAKASTVVTRATSYDNRANLARSWFDQVIGPYEGTSLGRQELLGVLLDEIEGALWSRSMFRYEAAPDGIDKVVVGVDPSVSDGAGAALCGIVVCAKAGDKYFVLGDYSLRGSPAKWAAEVARVYHHHDADRVVAEENQGGKMVRLVIKQADASLHYQGVHASVGKQARAEPVSMLYEQGHVSHVEPMDDLEDQLCTWTPQDGESPDRLDALVWAMASLSKSRYRLSAHIV